MKRNLGLARYKGYLITRGFVNDVNTTFITHNGKTWTCPNGLDPKDFVDLLINSSGY